MSGLGLHGRPARTLALCLAVLQLAVPMSVAWADARIEAEARVGAPGAHVESHPTNNCARLHAADCALCRFLSTPSGRSRVMSPELNPGAPAALALPEHAAGHPARATWLPNPRGPPTPDPFRAQRRFSDAAPATEVEERRLAAALADVPRARYHSTHGRHAAHVIRGFGGRQGVLLRRGGSQEKAEREKRPRP